MENLFPTGTIDPQVTERDIVDQIQTLENAAQVPDDRIRPERFDGSQANDRYTQFPEVVNDALDMVPDLNLLPSYAPQSGSSLIQEQDHMAEWAAYSLKKQGFGADPAFRLDPAKVKADIAGMDEAWNEELFESNSQDEYDFILDAGKKWTAREQEIAKMGGAGIAARLILNITDPTMVALSLGGQALIPAAFAAKSTRLGRIFKTATAVGTLNAAAEGAYMGLNPTTDIADVGTAFALGLVFGGVSGGLKGSGIGNELSAQGKKIIDVNETKPIPVPFGDATVHPRKMFNRHAPVTQPVGQATDSPKKLFNRVVDPAVNTAPASGTGLGELGQMGKGITDNMYGMLWDKLKKGDTTELGKPSNFLISAKAELDAGKIKSADDLRAYANTVYGKRQPEITPVSPTEQANYSTYNAGSVGAAGNPDARAPLTTTYQAIEGVEGGYGKLDAVRMDSVGAARRASESNWMKQGFSSILSDGVGSRSADDVHVSDNAASLRMQRIVDVNQSKWFKLITPEFRKWKGRNAPGWFNRGDAKGVFMHGVGDYVRWDDTKYGLREFDPEIRAAGERFRIMMRDNLRELKRAGVKGYADIPEDKFYFPMYLDKANVADIIRRTVKTGTHGGGWEGLVDVVANAIKRNSPDIDPALLARFAKGYMERLAKATYGMSDELRLVSNSLDGLISHIHEIIPGIDEVDARALARTLHRDPAGDPRTMSRAGLDYNERTKVWMDDGRGGQELREVSVGDFFVKDAEFAVMRYSRGAAGKIALAETQIRDGKGNIVMDGIRSQADIERLKQNIREDYATQHKADGHDNAAQRDEDLGKLDWAISLVDGTYQDLHNTARGKKLMRRIMDYNFIRLMNNMGVNQVQEFVGIYNQWGARAMFKGIPGFKRIIDTMGDKVKADAIVREMQGIMGLGDDTIFDKSTFRYDHELWNENRSGTAGAVLDRGIKWGKEKTLSISGMKYINAGLQQWAMKSAVMRFDEMAKAGFDSLQRGGLASKFFKGRDLQRLKSIGLRDEDIKAILQHFSDPNIIKRAPDGTIDSMNFSAWDPNVRVKFSDAVYRATHKAIQMNDPGELAKWMQGDVAKFVLQFKSFLLGAYTKQTLYGLRHMDSRQVTSWFMQLAAGSITYYGMGKVKQLAFSDEQQAEADEANKLGWRDVILQGIARTPVATLFPTAIDNVASLYTDPIWAQSRASGQATGGLDSLPITGALSSLNRTAKGIYGSVMEDREMTQSEKLGFANSGPFSNWLPLATFLKYLTNDSPTK